MTKKCRHALCSYISAGPQKWQFWKGDLHTERKDSLGENKQVSITSPNHS